MCWMIAEILILGFYVAAALVNVPSGLCSAINIVYICKSTLHFETILVLERRGRD